MRDKGIAIFLDKVIIFLDQFFLYLEKVTLIEKHLEYTKSHKNENISPVYLAFDLKIKFYQD